MELQVLFNNLGSCSMCVFQVKSCICPNWALEKCVLHNEDKSKDYGWKGCWVLAHTLPEHIEFVKAEEEDLGGLSEIGI